MVRLFICGVIVLNIFSCSQSDALLKQNVTNVVVNGSNGNSTECKMPGTPFLVVSNELRSENLRHIQVFMPNSEFSAENLKDLSLYFSDKFPTPKLLTVVAYTDWSQLDLPSCKVSGISGGGERPDKNAFHWGVFNRHGKNKTIRYLKTPNDEQMETIVIE